MEVGDYYNSESVDLMLPRQIYTAGQIAQPSFSGQRVVKPVHATLDPRDYSFHPHTWMKKFKVGIARPAIASMHNY